MNDDIIHRIVQTRLGGKVERCHNVPHHGSYSVASHSWGMLVLLWQIYPEHWARLAPVVMAHDVGEGWLGDVPAPTMRYVPGLRQTMDGLEGALVSTLGYPTSLELTEEEHAVFKAVDRLELYFWSWEQIAFGNRFAIDVLHELERYISEHPFPGKGFLIYQKLRGCDLMPKQAGVVRELLEKVQSQAMAEGVRD